jgi:hypothetical protein
VSVRLTAQLHAGDRIRFITRTLSSEKISDVLWDPTCSFSAKPT